MDWFLTLRPEAARPRIAEFAPIAAQCDARRRAAFLRRAAELDAQRQCNSTHGAAECLRISRLFNGPEDPRKLGVGASHRIHAKIECAPEGALEIARLAPPPPGRIPFSEAIR
jgi:hypothetical protein